MIIYVESRELQSQVTKKGKIGKEKIQVSNLNMIGILNLKDA